MNDDDHATPRYAKARFEYAVMEQADRTATRILRFETYDTYEWYLNLGPLANINAKYLTGKFPTGIRRWASGLRTTSGNARRGCGNWHASTVPNLNVAGFWDQEDPWGPWQIFRHAAEHDPEHTNFMVAGPWFHGQWHRRKADSIGLFPFGGHETATGVPRND